MNKLHPLTPITLAARDLGLSRQRLHVLIKKYEVAVKKIGTTGYLRSKDVEMLANQERKPGRPWPKKRQKKVRG